MTPSLKYRDQLAAFMEFWGRCFSEQRTLSRGEALRIVNEAIDGQASKKPDAEMTAYQDRVADVYGAYEDAQYQQAMIGHILEGLEKYKVPWNGHLVSLGCGPASYELWLLARKRIARLTLVDHSPGMLARAAWIAGFLGMKDKVRFIVADARENGLEAASADIVWTINAMHWSAHWRDWMKEVHRIAKPGAFVLASCTYGLQRSQIDPGNLGTIMRELFTKMEHAQVIPPQAIAGTGLASLSMRFFVTSKKPKSTIAPPPKKKKRG